MSDDSTPRDRWRFRRPAKPTVLTALAALLVLFALLAPETLEDFGPAAFLRIPIEALAGVALVLVLPVRYGRVLAVACGVLLGLLLVLRALDWGFFQTFDRPFDLVADWSFAGPAVDLLAEEIGRFAAVAVLILGVLAAAGLVVLMALALRRLARVVYGRREGAARTVAVFGVVWVICAVTALQFVDGKPIAARDAAGYAADRVQQVRATLQDRENFAREAAVDAFRDTPGDQLLRGLRGKDVVIAFVEAYGRFSIEDPRVAAEVDEVLDTGTARLRARGFEARSGFLTSPTSGGASWLAHSTLQSGVWIDNPLRYSDLLAGDRLTLTRAFRRAGWRTVSVTPAHTEDWPEGRFYGHQRFYDARNLGYRGPKFSYAPMPDQYTLEEFQRRERAAGHAPVMAEVDLVSSHWPWAPIPKLVGWNEVGDGSVFNPMPGAGLSTDEAWETPQRLRAAYRESIEYSLRTLISYVQNYGDDDLVLVMLGDHRPASFVTDGRASRDVPVTVIAGDPAVLRKVDGWGWHEGLNPGPRAPLWPMEAFRDRFFRAFS